MYKRKNKISSDQIRLEEWFTEEDLTDQDIEKKKNARDYVFSGRAIFTVETKKHNYCYTYRVKAGKEPNWFLIAVLIGPDNTKNYRNIGFVNLEKPLFYTNTSWQMEHTQPVKMFAAFMDVMFDKEPWPETCIFHKSKHCLRCGKLLTTTESIERGYGPECWAARHPEEDK